MLIGVPKEIKNHEYRVGLTPASARELVHHGHSVVVESNAGSAVGYSNEDYSVAGARIVETASEVFATSEMIVKVKEPQAVEYAQLREGQLLFTFLHLAPDLPQTEGLLQSGCVSIAYETITDDKGTLPLLKPMSEVAGRLAVQVGATALHKANGGSGVLLGGVPGVAPGKVVVIGGGVSGTHAARMAMGLEAEVVVLERSLESIDKFNALYGNRCKAIHSTKESIEDYVTDADLVIGAVLIPGASAPKLVRREHLGKMRKGSVLVDIAIDQGGCFETSHATTHQDPTYEVDGIIHYCVANMPGAVARTSTQALNNASLPFALALANKGYRQAVIDDKHLRRGLNTAFGKLTCAPVAEAHGMEHTTAKAALGL